jgi:hypothetical protein
LKRAVFPGGRFSLQALIHRSDQKDGGWATATTYDTLQKVPFIDFMEQPDDTIPQDYDPKRACISINPCSDGSHCQRDSATGNKFTCLLAEPVVRPCHSRKNVCGVGFKCQGPRFGSRFQCLPTSTTRTCHAKCDSIMQCLIERGSNNDPRCSTWILSKGIKALFKRGLNDGCKAGCSRCRPRCAEEASSWGFDSVSACNMQFCSD